MMKRPLLLTIRDIGICLLIVFIIGLVLYGHYVDRREPVQEVCSSVFHGYQYDYKNPKKKPTLDVYTESRTGVLKIVNGRAECHYGYINEGDM